MKRRTFIGTGLGVAAGLAVGGAGRSAVAQDAALVEAAKKEGKVVWYASVVANQLARPLADAFQKTYGITVELVGGSATDLVVRLANEARAGRIMADVSHGAANIRAPLMAAGVVDRYVPPSAAEYPASLKDPEGYWVAQSVYFLTAAYNTDLVRPGDVPKTYQDLLDPKHRGRIAWTNALVQGGPPGFIGTVLLSMGVEAGTAYLKRLAEQKIVNVPANPRVVLDKVIAGEYPMALMVFNNHVAISARQGAPIKRFDLNPVTGFIDTTFVIKGGPNPNAARLFMNFVVSREGQTVFRDADYLPAHPQVEARVTDLKPEAGGFTPLYLPVEGVEENLKTWIAAYEANFK